MSTHKNIDRICITAIIVCILLTIAFMSGSLSGMAITVHAMGYENRLFDTDKVHTIDIIMDDWDEFLKTAQSKVYSDCTVIIDGETYKNVGIRGKGNTSLSTVSSMDSERYSFKIEFDQYDSNKSYHGLDKLCLNNIIQDNTYMKDYLTYRMMNEFGVSAPLCSFAYITVNGEDWGLYLAAEGIEDSFLKRNYGNSYGELYKPDSMSFGGGRGNGKNFDIENFNKNFDSENTKDRFSQFAPPDIQGDMMQMPGGMRMPENFDFSAMENGEFQKPDMGGFGMGSTDVKLKYSDDNYDSYSNIFNSAKTDITNADKTRLIASLKDLSNYENLEEVVDIEKVIRYFVVHNFVCNGDSYTGSMIHNYYLYEENGQLSMIPWDYNLAYGTFQGGNATNQVNSPVDTPVSGDINERPMVGWIFSDDNYTEIYHEYFSEFLAQVDITGEIYQTEKLISEYVEKDPTKFCTYEEFEKGVDALRTFCQLRSDSVKGQLNGTIPSTTEGQSEDDSALIDASNITLSDMGTMNMGGKGGFGRFDGEMPDFGDFQIPTDENGDSVMHDRFGEGMPNFQNPGNQNQSTQTEDVTNETEQIPNDKNNNNAQPGHPGGMSNFGNMLSMQGNSNQQNNTLSYILLGVSTLILAGGLIFAFKFKR